MTPALSIARRDLLAAFTSPMAWLVIAVWLLVTGIIFAIFLSTLHGTAGASEPLFATTLWASVFLLVFIAPALTMNSFASERAQGTMQLLLTVPVREWHLVIGKWVAAFALLVTLAVASATQLAVLWFVSDLHLPHVAVAYGGFVLLAALLGAVGVWISLLVDSPVAAYVLTLGAFGVSLLTTPLMDFPGLTLVARTLALLPRAERLFAGQLVLGDAAWFAAGTAIFLVLATAALRARRLHG